MYEDIEAVLDEHVRPLLRTHGGEMEIIEVEDGVVRFKLKGKCAGCPAADLTTEELIQTALTEHLPHIKRAVLVQDISPELLDEARAAREGAGTDDETAEAADTEVVDD